MAPRSSQVADMHQHLGEILQVHGRGHIEAVVHLAEQGAEDPLPPKIAMFAMAFPVWTVGKLTLALGEAHLQRAKELSKTDINP